MLNYLNNRYYDSSVGGFLSVDPIVDETGEPLLAFTAFHDVQRQPLP